MTKTIELRLTGEASDVDDFIRWLKLTRMKIKSEGRARRDPGRRRYIRLEPPRLRDQLEITFHPGNEQHPPALMLRAQAGAVAVGLDRVGPLCEKLAEVAAEGAEWVVTNGQ